MLMLLIINFLKIIVLFGQEKTVLIISIYMIRTENYAIKWPKGTGSNSYYGFDEKQILFYQSTENGSINRAIYRIALNGEK
jgi:hypothetical protein